MSEEESQMLAWIKRDGEAIKSVWLKNKKGMTLEQYAVMLWNKKKMFADILRKP